MKKMSMQDVHFTVENCFFERLFLVYNYFSDCQVIVLPSYRDVHHDYVYPQPPFFHQSQNSRMKAKTDYPVITLLKLSLLFNGSTDIHIDL